MIGDDVPVDAANCSLGRVVGLDPQGDNFLAVRGGPGTGHAKIDELHEGDHFYFCDAQGRWMGIVYSPDVNVPGSDPCDIFRSIVPRQPYPGPCSSGWVFDGYVEIIAG
jgi:hypothetical protein